MLVHSGCLIFLNFGRFEFVDLLLIIIQLPYEHTNRASKIIQRHSSLFVFRMNRSKLYSLRTLFDLLWLVLKFMRSSLILREFSNDAKSKGIEETMIKFLK